MRLVAAHVLNNQSRFENGFVARDLYRAIRRFRQPSARDDLYGALDELEIAGWLTKSVKDGEKFSRYEIDAKVCDGRFDR